MKNIILIGAGQLGSRHLQALALLQQCYSIYVVDPVEESLSRAEKLYHEVPSASNHSLHFVFRLDDISARQFDYAIIATNSNVRFAVLSQLTARFEIKHILFEKILFQELRHYQKAGALLAERGIKAWVNCPRRSYYFYRLLKETHFSGSDPIEFEFCGGEQVGLACNAIHFIDILNFLSNEKLCRVLTDGLDAEVISSKRDGFVEFSGRLICEFERGSRLIFIAEKGGSQKSRSIVKQADTELRMDEVSGHYDILRAGTVEHSDVLQVPFQSRLTNQVIAQIEASGNCDLVGYSTSAALHLPFIKALLDFYNFLNKSDQSSLPIT